MSYCPQVAIYITESETGRGNLTAFGVAVDYVTSQIDL
jgi:hypothetical protein